MKNYTRFKEDVYSNIGILKDTMVEVFDNRSYELLQDRELNKGLTTFEEDDIQRLNGKVSIEIPLMPTKFEKLPKNRDTRNVISNAIKTLYDNAREGMWKTFANPSGMFGYFGYEDLEDYGVTKESDITNEIIDDIAKRINSRDPNDVIDSLSWGSSNPQHFYNLLIETSFRTFKGTDSVDVILKMYIVEEDFMSKSKRIVVDSYEPIVFGFTTDIIEGRDKDGSAYTYLDSMLDDLTSQF